MARNGEIRHLRRLAAASTAVLVLLTGACGGSDGATTSPPDAADDDRLDGSAAPATTDGIGGVDVSAVPTTVADPIASVEQDLALAPVPTPGELGDSWSGSLLRALAGSPDDDLVDVIEDVERQLLVDAGTQVETTTDPTTSTDPTTATDPTATGPATTSGTGGALRSDALGRAAPLDAQRRLDVGAGFGGLGIALVGMADGLATRPGVQASASGGTTTSGPSATGSVAVGVGGGRDAAGRRTAEVSMTVDASSADGRSASVTVAASLTGYACPLDDGILELTFEGHADVAWSGSTSGRGSQQFSGTLTAYFDDDGEASRIDLDLRLETSRAAGSGTGTGTGSYADISYRSQISNMFAGTPSESSTATINRASSTFDAANADDARMIDDARSMASKFALGAFVARRERVQNNGCVTVQVKAPATARTDAEVHVEIHTFHVVDNIELDKPVDASLSGAGSISSDHLPGTASAIIYTAGSNPGDTGTIALESRSRRGIGRTTVTIAVKTAYRIDEPVGDLRLQGFLCGLDQPFTLGSYAPAEGLIVFTPTGPGGGTYSGHGKVGDTEATIEWTGTYTVDGADTDHPTIRMDEGTTIMKNIPYVGQAPLPGFWSGGVTLSAEIDPAGCEPEPLP